MIAWWRPGVASQPEKPSLAVSPFISDSTGRKKRKQQAEKKKRRNSIREATAEF